MAAEINPVTGEDLNFASGISFYCFLRLCHYSNASTLAVTKETNSWNGLGQLIFMSGLLM
jgi:hypothetical protein